MLPHPCLLVNQQMIQAAKDHMAAHAWASETCHRLQLDADKLEAMQLPKFETAWWQEAKKKPYHDIYPEEMQHTYYVPRPPTDLVWRSALVYQLGGGDIYAERARRVLLHYTSYDFVCESPDVGMNYSIWGINLLQAYDMVYDRFTLEERAKVDDFFDRMVRAVAKSDEWWIETGTGGRHNNHYAWHKSMMAAYGLFYGKDEWVTRAIESRDGFRELLDVGLLDDGLWFESSLNYHYVALSGLMNTAQMFRNAGYPLDLYTHKFANGRTLEDGFSGMIQVLFPDTSIPTTGDCYGGTSRLKGSPFYETAWNVYHKPEYAWLTEGMKPTWQALFYPSFPTDHLSLITDYCPRAKSRVFEEHGYAILRSVEGTDYWGGDSWAAFLNYYLDSVHSHRDKMNLILFGRGKVLAPDPEARASVPHAFSSQVQRELNRSTLCHNTLMVDGKQHNGIGENLSLLDFKRTPEVKTATIADLKGLVYPGVKLQRTVAVTDDYVLDVFQAASDEEHAYDWLFHAIDDEGKTRIYGGFTPTTLPDAVPWTWLRNPRSAVKDDTWHADWHQGDLRFRLTMLGVPGTEVTASDFPKNDKFESPPIPMLIVRRKAKSATFIALYQAERHDLPPAAISTSMKDGKLKIEVTLNGKTSVHTLQALGTKQSADSSNTW